MELTALQYDAIDNSSSAALLAQIRWASRNGQESADLYTSNGWRVSVPTWAITCALAEREEQEASSYQG